LWRRDFANVPQNVEALVPSAVLKQQALRRRASTSNRGDPTLSRAFLSKFDIASQARFTASWRIGELALDGVSQGHLKRGS
jgi:hypothetical protein